MNDVGGGRGLDGLDVDVTEIREDISKSKSKCVAEEAEVLDISICSSTNQLIEIPKTSHTLIKHRRI